MLVETIPAEILNAFEQPMADEGVSKLGASLGSDIVVWSKGFGLDGKGPRYSRLDSFHGDQPIRQTCVHQLVRLTRVWNPRLAQWMPWTAVPDSGQDYTHPVFEDEVQHE